MTLPSHESTLVLPYMKSWACFNQIDEIFPILTEKWCHVEQRTSLPRGNNPPRSRCVRRSKTLSRYYIFTFTFSRQKSLFYVKTLLSSHLGDVSGFVVLSEMQAAHEKTVCDSLDYAWMLFQVQFNFIHIAPWHLSYRAGICWYITWERLNFPTWANTILWPCNCISIIHIFYKLIWWPLMKYSVEERGNCLGTEPTLFHCHGENWRCTNGFSSMLLALDLSASMKRWAKC